MSALLSLVVSLAPRGPGVAEPGDVVQGWVLDLVRARNATLAERLHANERHKPYTLSPLRWIPEERRAELRVSALGQDVSSGLLASFHDAPPRTHLGGVSWDIAGVAVASEQHPWAALTTAARLFEDAVRSDARAAALRFESPTAFGGTSAATLFPDPRLVYRHLTERWRLLAADGAQPTPEEDWFRHVRVRAYQLETVDLGRHRRHVHKGFVGECEYDLAPGAPPGTRRWLLALSSFAFFAGIGMATARGMGQTTCRWR